MATTRLDIADIDLITRAVKDSVYGPAKDEARRVAENTMSDMVRRAVREHFSELMFDGRVQVTKRERRIVREGDRRMTLIDLQPELRDARDVLEWLVTNPAVMALLRGNQASALCGAYAELLTLVVPQ